MDDDACEIMMTHIITRIESVDPLPLDRTSEPLRTPPNPPNSKPGNARISFPETPAGVYLSGNGRMELPARPYSPCPPCLALSSSRKTDLLSQGFPRFALRGGRQQLPPETPPPSEPGFSLWGVLPPPLGNHSGEGRKVTKFRDFYLEISREIGDFLLF